MTDKIFSESKKKVSSVKKIEFPYIQEGAHKSIYVYLCSADLTFKIITRKEYSKMLSEFYRQMTHYLMTTRFNNESFRENRAFCERNPSIECAYGSPVEISSSIPAERILFILEMNNETNSIEGIGMVKNRPCCRKYNIYGNMNYNRFIYTGKYRIDKSDFTESEKKVIKMVGSFCFRGHLHMKRGHGITGYATRLLFHFYPIIDIIRFIREMFKERISVHL